MVLLFLKKQMVEPWRRMLHDRVENCRTAGGSWGPVETWPLGLRPPNPESRALSTSPKSSSTLTSEPAAPKSRSWGVKVESLFLCGALRLQKYDAPYIWRFWARGTRGLGFWLGLRALGSFERLGVLGDLRWVACSPSHLSAWKLRAREPAETRSLRRVVFRMLQSRDF